MNKKYNIGVIGPGSNYSKKFHHIFEEKFKKIFILRKNSKSFKNKTTFTDSDIFFNQKLDLIYISTPPESNLFYIKKCLDKNIPTICEKPAIINFDYNNKCLLKRIKESKSIFIENFSYTSHKIFNDLHKIVNKNSISFVKCSFQYPFLEKKNFRYKNNGFFFDSCVYPISLETFLFKQILSKRTKIKVNYLSNFNGSIILNNNNFDRLYSWGTGSEYKNEVEIFFKNGSSVFVNKIFSKNLNDLLKLSIHSNKKNKIKNYPYQNQEEIFLDKILTNLDNPNHILFRSYYSSLLQHSNNLKIIYEKIFKI